MVYGGLDGIVTTFVLHHAFADGWICHQLADVSQYLVTRSTPKDYLQTSASPFNHCMLLSIHPFPIVGLPALLE